MSSFHRQTFFSSSWGGQSQPNEFFAASTYRLVHKKLEMIKIWPITKNLQYLSYHHETWSKWHANEVVFLTKFHNDNSKIVDFLLIFKFWSCPVFYGPVSRIPKESNETLNPAYKCFSLCCCLFKSFRIKETLQVFGNYICTTYRQVLTKSVSWRFFVRNVSNWIVSFEVMKNFASAHYRNILSNRKMANIFQHGLVVTYLMKLGTCSIVIILHYCEDFYQRV